MFQWLDTIVLNWLTRIFNQGTLKVSSNDSHITTIIADFKVKLGYYLVETYANTIIEQFFNIIVGEKKNIFIVISTSTKYFYVFCAQITLRVNQLSMI